MENGDAHSFLVVGDTANNLTSATSTTLSYDAGGRLAKTVGSSTTQFAYDGSDMIAEYDGSGTMLRRYVHGPGDDEPLVWYEGTGTSDRRWLVADRLGSIVAVTNGSGVSTGTNTYDEYGLPGSSNLGRFLRTDPIGYGDGMNWYAYVGGDPVNGWDPTGLDGIQEVVVNGLD